MSFQEFFKEKRVLITGASKGVGKALVLKLSELGAIVYAISRNSELLKTLSVHHPIYPICVDIEDWKQTKETLEEMEVTFDLLINNAGIGIPQTFLEISPEIFEKMMRANVQAMINISQVFSKKLIAENQPGCILNMSSALTTVTVPNLGLYSATKCAINSLTRTMANELGKYQIRVNSLCPAMVQADLYRMPPTPVDISDSDQNLPEGQPVIIQKPSQSIPAPAVNMDRYPLGECFISIDQVVNSALFLLSDMCPLIHGESLVIDGGRRTT